MATKPTHGSKAAFVRSIPKTVKAAEVVKRAAAKGITLSVNYVYISRSKRGGGAAKTPRAARVRGQGTLQEQLETLANDFARKIALAAIDDVVSALRTELR